MEVIGSQTSDNPAALDQQENSDTTSKLPLNSVKNNAADPLLPALSRQGQKTSPRGNTGVRAISERRVRCGHCGVRTCDVIYFVYFEQYTIQGLCIDTPFATR